MSTNSLDASTYVLDETARQILDNGNLNICDISGINNTATVELKPSLEFTNGEKIIEGLSNCFMILGRDRPGGISSGNGGVGKSGAACIDIVVGLMGSRPEQNENSIFLAQKDFKSDSARVYISQACNLDKYFGIPSINVNITANTIVPLEDNNDTSGIGLKADHVRLVARENIKIVTSHLEPISLPRDAVKGGIDLIAGYDVAGFNQQYQLQPMVRGNNLVNCLKEIVTVIKNINANFSNFSKHQRKINSVFMTHTHQSGDAGKICSPVVGNDSLEHQLKHIIETLPDTIYNVEKVSLLEQYYNTSHPLFINSKWHRLN